MGTFDSVMVPCPTCGKEHEAQSKSGSCSLDEYSLKTAPEDVLQDVNRHAPFKCACGSRFEVDLARRMTCLITTQENFMPRLNGVSFRCETDKLGRPCGCNVFHKEPGRPDRFICNSCGSAYIGVR